MSSWHLNDVPYTCRLCSLTGGDIFTVTSSRGAMGNTSEVVG